MLKNNKKMAKKSRNFFAAIFFKLLKTSLIELFLLTSNIVFISVSGHRKRSKKALEVSKFQNSTAEPRNEKILKLVGYMLLSIKIYMRLVSGC